MSDESLRSAERAWKAEESEENAERFLNEIVQAGQIPWKNVLIRLTHLERLLGTFLGMHHLDVIDAFRQARALDNGSETTARHALRWMSGNPLEDRGAPPPAPLNTILGARTHAELEQIARAIGYPGQVDHPHFPRPLESWESIGGYVVHAYDLLPDYSRPPFRTGQIFYVSDFGAWYRYDAEDLHWVRVVWPVEEDGDPRDEPPPQHLSREDLRRLEDEARNGRTVVTPDLAAPEPLGGPSDTVSGGYGELSIDPGTQPVAGRPAVLPTCPTCPHPAHPEEPCRDGECGCDRRPLSARTCPECRHPWHMGSPCRAVRILADLRVPCTCSLTQAAWVR